MSSSPTKATLKKLFAFSGNVCAFPRCREQIFDREGSRQLGDIAHIEAQSEGGPRYNPRQTDAQRQGFDNLMLMCPTHHRRIDMDVETYPVEWLVARKRNHERTMGKKSPQSGEAGEAFAAAYIQGNEVAITTIASGGANQTAQHITNNYYHADSQPAIKLEGHFSKCLFGSRPFHETAAYSQWLGYAQLILTAREPVSIDRLEILHSDRLEPSLLREAGPLIPDGTNYCDPVKFLGVSSAAFVIPNTMSPLQLSQTPTKLWVCFRVSPGSHEEALFLGPPPVSMRVIVRLRQAGGFHGWKLTQRFTDVTKSALPKRAPEKTITFANTLNEAIQFTSRIPATVEMESDW